MAWEGHEGLFAAADDEHVGKSRGESGTGGKLDVFGDGTGLDVKNDRVVDLDVWVGVSDGAGVVGDQEWDSLLGDAGAHNAAELVAGFLGRDAVDGEATLHIVDEAEVLVGFLDGDHVHSGRACSGPP